MRIRNAGPALFLVLFGGVFSLLGALTLSIVISGASGREQLLFANVVPLVVAALFLAGAAWIFGTALRLPFRRHPLGHPQLVLTPPRVRPGARLALAVRVVPERAVTLEEVFAQVASTLRVELTPPLGSRAIAAGAESVLSGEVELPELFDGKQWTVRLVIVTREAPDWIHEEPLPLEG